VKQLRWFAAVTAFSLIAVACGSDDDSGNSAVGDTVANDSASDDSASTDSATGDTASIDTGSSDSAPSDGAVNDTSIVLGMATEPTLLDAHLTRDAPQNYATWSVNEALVDIDTDGSVIPLLAESFEPDSADPLKWTVKIRQGIEFSNGEPWNADALVANVTRILDPDFASPIPPDFSALIGAEKVDDSTVSLLLSQVDPILAFRLKPFKMVPPLAAAEPDYSEHPVGTGPYTFVEWVKGERIKLQANPDYWGDPKPTIGSVEFRFIPDEATRVAALKAGELDFAMNIPFDQLSDAPQIIETKTPTQTQIIRLNLNVAPTNDVNFRQALNYAIDKDALNEAFFGGQASPNKCQLGAPGIGGFNSDLEAYPYDPDKAKELLAGIDMPDGFKLRIDTSGTRFTRNREMIQAIADYWQKVGVEVEINDLESDAWRELALADRNSTQALYLESDYALPHSIGNYTKNATIDGSVSVRGTLYPELEDPLARAFTSTDAAARDEGISEVSKITCDAAFWVFLLDRIDTAGASARLHYDVPQGEFFGFQLNRMTVDS
jgi:peptide/nickel transport system substrate-binding protein